MKTNKITIDKQSNKLYTLTVRDNKFGRFIDKLTIEDIMDIGSLCIQVVDSH